MISVIFVSTTLAEAPSYSVEMEIVGTSISGYSRTGMLRSPINPKTIRISINTMVATGRTTEKEQIVIAQLLS